MVVRHVSERSTRRHPPVDSGVSEFVSFIRSQRLPVSMRMIQERALSIAESAQIADFRAFRGRLKKVLRLPGTQIQFAYTGKGSLIYRSVTRTGWGRYETWQLHKILRNFTIKMNLGYFVAWVPTGLTL